MRVRLGGKYWRIIAEKVKEDPDLFGQCDDEKQIIRINPESDGKALLTTLIHEALHAEFPWLEEEAVIRASYNLAALLDRLGAEIELPPRK